MTKLSFLALKNMFTFSNAFPRADLRDDIADRGLLCVQNLFHEWRQASLLRSTRYKKQFNTFHCGGTIYLSASDSQDCNKTRFRNTDMTTPLAFWTSFTQRQRQSCTGSGLTLLDPVKMSNDALDLLISLFFYVWASLFLCLRVSSPIARKVFVLHVCIYSCGDAHLHTHLPVLVIWWTRRQQRAKVLSFSKHSTREQHFTLCTKTWSEQLWSEIKLSCVPKMLWHVSDNWLDAVIIITYTESLIILTFTDCCMS